MALEQDKSEEQEADESSDRPLGKAPPKYPEPRRGAGGGGPAAVVTVSGSEGGFFSIYKKGQGYWTRMGTALGALLIAGLCAAFIYDKMIGYDVKRSVALGITGGFLVVFGLLVFWLMNKPGNADFLIATDSEMKKVNWTTKKDLMGSTKVVILFMFLIAAFLFVVDIVFGFLFYGINVLETKPF